MLEILRKTRVLVSAKLVLAVLVAILFGLTTFAVFAPASAVTEPAKNTQADEAPVAEIITRPRAEEPVAEPAKEAPKAVEKSTKPAVAKQVASSAPAAVDPSLPVYINIGGLIHSAITPVGLDSAGAVAVPSQTVGWWTGSAKIGATSGASFLDGHSTGVFRNLAAVGVGDQISVTMGDGSVILFQVAQTRVFDYNYSNPSASENYQLMSAALTPIKAGVAGLNLMTCAGQPVGNNYTQRLVVFAVKI